MDLQGTDGANALTGGAGDDVIYGFGGNDTLKGGAGDDVLAGHSGNDVLQGGDGEDYLLGGAGNDTLDGGAGGDWAAYEDATAAVKVDLNNTNAQNTGGGGADKLTGIEHVYGSAYNDVLIGNADNNMMVGDAGNDSLTGGKGDDTLWGDTGTDTLDGGDGDDYLVGGAGDDTVKGGAGWDWSSYENATAGVAVDLTKSGAAQDTGGAGKDLLTGIEHLYGSKFNDVLTGDANDNYLWGADGDDKLYGGAGDDHLSGGAGNNIISGGDGWDTVDYAFSTTGVRIDLNGAVPSMGGSSWVGDILSSIEAAMGSAYNDVIIGNAAENYLFGDAGNDTITAAGGHDVLDGGDGDDFLIGDAIGIGNMLIGGAGNDQLSVSNGSTTVDGGEGIDALQTFTYVGVKVDLRIAGDQEIAKDFHVDVRGIENLIGGHGNDVLIGNAGDNVIEGLTGNDVMDGGAGFDIAAYRSAPQGVRVDLSKVGVAQDTGGHGIDTLTNFEGLKGSVYNDILIGDAKANTFEGGAGDDIIDGGAGADTAIYDGASKDYTWSRNADGTWTVRHTYLGVDTLLNVETLKFNDKLVTLSPSATTVTVDDLEAARAITGTEGVDLLIGTTGADRILGLGGSDRIIGGRGADVLTGGEGSDRFLFGTGDTAWSVSSETGIDTITDWQSNDYLSFSTATGSYTEKTANNWLEALDKASIAATQGTQAIAVQVEGNVYVFGAENGFVQNVVKLLGANLDQISFDNFDWRTGAALNGDSNANVLWGGLADDVINGMAGDDVIVGWTGKDILTGGAGADIFKFQWGDSSPVLANADIITDFGQGDKLAFSNAPATVKESDILRFTAEMNPDGTISAASQSTIDDYKTLSINGALSQKYLVISAGADTYILADTDVAPWGFDLSVMLKGVTSSLFTADMITGA